jgi:hypothetical protein
VATGSSGIGIHGSAFGSTGIALLGEARATTGTPTGVYGTVFTAKGTAGRFDNLAGGKILSLRNNGVERARVDDSGYTGPLGMVMYHASFQAGSQTTVGTGNGFTLYDGMMFLQSGISAGAVADQTSDNAQTFPFPGLDKPGAFFSIRLKAFLTPFGDEAAYFIAGGTDGGGNLLRNGFGFKYAVNGLNGVAILNGAESLVDLKTMLGTLTIDPPADLLAVRRASSIDFYVNGVLKGSVNTNLPSIAYSTYELRLDNHTSQGHQTFAVSFLTLGIPML